MDDILLGQTELDTLYESNREYHEYNPEKWEQAICRAQLRKVVKWMKKHDNPLMVDAESLGYVVISEEDMQALRAAAEEVRG